jgi:hypothetical protein
MRIHHIHPQFGINRYFDDPRPLQRIKFRLMADLESMTEKWRVKP